MIGYEMIHNIPLFYKIMMLFGGITILTSTAVGLVLKTTGGIGGNMFRGHPGVTNRRAGVVPVKFYEKKDNGDIHDRIEYHEYGAFSRKKGFEWRWIDSVRSMGFVQDKPPAQVAIIASPGMREIADEILKRGSENAES